MMDWKAFSAHCREELAAPCEWTRKLQPGDAVWTGTRLGTRSGIPPLSPNNRLLLETIAQLKPMSVLEVGCGAGDNLANVKALLPETEVWGFDVSPDQVDLARERAPELADQFFVWDAAWPSSEVMPKVQLTFAHVVLMHINDSLAYLMALSNMFRMASRYVILLENWETHSFVEDILDLRGRMMIPWRPHIYYRVSPEYHRPHLILCSRRPAGYRPLIDYQKTMLEPLFAAPDSKIGMLPGQEHHIPKPVWRQDGQGQRR